jgi:hypothetical protein
MTGFESKRQMAQAKVRDDDDTQVYADTLLIAYQSGFADGKKSAQPEPTCPECKAAVLYECVACSSNNYPPRPEQEPVAYYHPHKGFYWAKPTHISAPTVVDVPPVPLYVKWKAAQRPWQGLTEEDWAKVGDMPDAFDQGVAWAAARLKERNNG